jgi:crossover junction endodeoxyribonuclease RuvC
MSFVDMIETLIVPFDSLSVVGWGENEVQEVPEVPKVQEVKYLIMKVLGIDPGYGRFGWAVLEGNRARQTLLACGCEETLASAGAPSRYLAILEKLEGLIEEFKPEEAAVETLFFFKNAKTVIKVSESRGVVVVGLVRAGVAVYDYTPLQVKQTVTGYGRAEKQQIQTMVKAILKLKEVPKPDDAADAVAVGLTHLMTNQEIR